MSLPVAGSHGAPLPSGALDDRRSQKLPIRLILSLALILIVLWMVAVLSPWQPRFLVFSVALHTVTEFGAIVAALLVAIGVFATLAADLHCARDRKALEGELQRTYVRLRAAEAATQAPTVASSAPAADQPADSSS